MLRVMQLPGDGDIDEDDETTSLIFLGIGVTIIGGFIDNLGLTQMKISHRSTAAALAPSHTEAAAAAAYSGADGIGVGDAKELKSTSVVVEDVDFDLTKEVDDEPPQPLRETPYFFKTRWLAGFVLFTIGNIMNVVGLSFAPQSLFATLGALGLVWNALNSRFILGETLTLRIGFGTCIVFVGTSLSVLFGSSEAENFNLEELWDNFRSQKFVVFLICILLLTIGIQVALRMFEKRMAACEQFPEANGSSLPAMKKALSFLYPSFAGLIGSLTVLFAKSSTNLVNTSISGDNQFDYVASYFIVLATLVFGATQIHWINRGLRLYDQLIIVPTFNVCFSLFTILGGGTFFDEFSSFGTTEWILFPFSVCVTFCGVYFISVPKNKSAPLPAPSYYENRRTATRDFTHEVLARRRSFVAKRNRPSYRNTYAVGGPHGFGTRALLEDESFHELDERVPPPLLRSASNRSATMPTNLNQSPSSSPTRLPLFPVV